MSILLLPFRFPMIVTALFGLTMLVIAHFDPWRLAVNSIQWLAGLIVCFGLVIVVLSVWKFGIARTTVNPSQPDKASALVIAGIYQYSRNPMYVGFLCWLIGLGLYLGSGINVLLIIFYIAIIQWFYIYPEEASLRNKFGDQYNNYCQHVRRWL